MFDNEKMVELVSQAAERATPVAPLLELGSDAWLVMANLNAHLMEACCSRGRPGCNRGPQYLDLHDHMARPRSNKRYLQKTEQSNSQPLGQKRCRLLARH